MSEENIIEQLHLLQQELDIYKKQTDSNIHNINKEISELDGRVKEMELSKQKTDYQYEQIMETLKTLNEKTIPNLASQIEELKNKPVKRYDQAVTGILGAIFGAIGAFIAGLFLKNN